MPRTKTKTIRMATKQQTPNKNWSRQEWDTYIKEKEVLVDRIFKEADRQGLSDEEFAERAKLHRNTIYRLNHYMTSNPCFSTIWKLAKAVGMTLLVAKLAAKRKSA